MHRATRLTVFTFLAFFVFAASASAQLAIPGEVVDVIDGKTVLVAIPGSREHARSLSGGDTGTRGARRARRRVRPRRRFRRPRNSVTES